MQYQAELGFTLEEVRSLLLPVDGGNVSCAEVLENANRHLGRIRSKIRDLKKMETTLGELAKRCSGDEVPDCPIIDVLWRV